MKPLSDLLTRIGWPEGLDGTRVHSPRHVQVVGAARLRERRAVRLAGHLAEAGYPCSVEGSIVTLLRAV